MYKIIRKTILLFLFVIFSLSLFINLLVWLVSYKFIYEDINFLPETKYALILGTSKYTSSGEKNIFYYERIDKAVDLIQNKKVQYLVLSGTKDTGYDEVEWIKKDLLKKGVSEKKLVLDKNGDRTYDSIANFLKKFPEEKAFIIVSQKFHLERAIFLTNILDREKISYGYVAESQNTTYNFKTFSREFFARLKMIFVDLIF